MRAVTAAALAAETAMVADTEVTTVMNVTTGDAADREARQYRRREATAADGQFSVAVGRS
jgi:hypothetical protein